MLASQGAVSYEEQLAGSSNDKAPIPEEPSTAVEAAPPMTPPYVAACYARPPMGNFVRGEKLVRHMESSPELGYALACA
ncbi:unnamed protein product [Heligmosomoides polygyrus]|uniref:Uncharacterized protein n=1 Tax=Heligmosomoides polygyrus TaxID=6339 RepID=A0A3P7WGU4_HELPZ|nr:unnamed protein product [Heligmosomoides polygyrus]